MRKAITLILASFLLCLSFMGCGRKESPTKSEHGSIIIEVAYPTKDSKPAKLQAVDKMTAYVYEQNGTRIASANLERSGSVGKAEITVTEGQNRRVDVVAYSGNLVNYIGRDPDVDVVAGQTATASINMGLVVPEFVNLPDFGTANEPYSINWTNISGIDNYVVERDQNQSFGNPQRVYSGKDNSTSENISGGGSYYYRVRVETSYGNSLWSDPGMVRVIVRGTINVKVGWPEGATSIKTVIYKGGTEVARKDLEKMGDFGTAIILSLPETGLTVDVIAYAGDAIIYFGREQNVSVSSGETISPTINLIPMVPSITYAPQTVTINEDFDVTWTNIIGANRYELEAAESPSFESIIFSNEYSESTSQFFIGSPGDYFLRVRAIFGFGPSAWSEAVKITGVEAPTTGMVIINAIWPDKVDRMLASLFDSAGDIIGEVVTMEHVASGATVGVEVPEGSGMSAVVIAYSGQAMRNVGVVSSVSVTAGGETRVDVPLESVVPSLNAPLSAVIGETFTVTWNTVRNAKEYELQGAGNQSFTDPSKWMLSSNTQDLTPKNPGNYYLRVRAIFDSGMSDWSEIVMVNFVETPTMGLVSFSAPWPEEADRMVAYLFDSAGNTIGATDMEEAADRAVARIESPDEPGILALVLAYSGDGIRSLGAVSDVKVVVGGETKIDVTLHNVIPSLTSPPTVGVDQEFTVSWDKVPANPDYELQISGDDWPWEIEYGGPDTETQVIENEPGNLYFRVRSLFEFGPSVWSEVVMTKVEGGVIIPKDMALIPGGEFIMGDSRDEGDTDEQPPHMVYEPDFYIAKYEVTNEKYKEFCDVTGYYYPLDPGFPDMPNYFLTHPDHPVVNVSWYDAIIFCNWLSERDGLEPCYDQFFVVDFSKNGYRLPTESEWEKAARGGSEGINFPWGDSYPTGSQCNFADANADGITAPEGFVIEWAEKSVDDGYTYTSPIGSYPPNGYGLYNMAGNVFEWCYDGYLDYYSEDYLSSPYVNPEASYPDVVMRGGAWAASDWEARCSYRFVDNREWGYSYVGFRYVRNPGNGMGKRVLK